jgi:hypothetical protein
LFQVRAGRRDDAHIDFDRAVSTDTLKLAFLQDTQQFHLKLNGHVPDFIQKNSPTVCLLEAADPSRYGAGESRPSHARTIRFEANFPVSRRS